MTEIAITYEDHGKTIEAHVGTLLSVKLNESPTTGYVWSNKTPGDVLALQNTDFSSLTSGTLGGTGMRTLQFMVKKPGNTLLLLKQMREWEGDSSAIKEFSVSIHAVQP